ncbi:MAG: glycosyltransferase family 4 protein, partial [Bacilli bacterium]|nr:glycosyltransferase family 4 protein [Bacilli bacterium]
MIKIIGLYPLSGNGGIASWTKKFLNSFPDEQYKVFPINNSPIERHENSGIILRIVSGLKALIKIYKNLNEIIKQEHTQILHTTTSGSLGSFRDYIVGRICRKRKIKSIMHCRYGCISEDIKSNGIVGILLRAALKQYDQIWVLDSTSFNTLNSLPEYINKTKLTPNSIEVPEKVNLSPKKYNRMGFIGNLIPSKGIFELIEAAKNSNTQLDIIGPGSDEIINKIKNYAGKYLNSLIYIHGRLDNEKAIEFLNQLDIIALPTYYPSEAFPISILEAMSRGKLVISCPRAAIKDMLTDLNGNNCGILVEPKSHKAIEDALYWIKNHPQESDLLCANAYEKVKRKYDVSIVYQQYRNNYKS